MKKINNITTTSAMFNDNLAKFTEIKYYNFAAGDPNCEVQQSIIEAYAKLQPSQVHQYGSFNGEYTLRKFLFPTNADQVVIANGAKQLLFMSLQAITSPNDEIVIIGPCWSSYIKICELLNLKYKLIIGEAQNLYMPSIEQVCKSISNKTCAVLFNNPNNPTGVVYSKTYIETLYDCCILNNCWLISDEIYKEIIFDINEIPFISLRGLKNTIVIDGFSKAYNITGWRLGYCICEESLATAIANLQSQISGPPNILVQNIMINSWDLLQPPPINIYRERRDLLSSINNKFKQFTPKGGFYFYLPINNQWKSSSEVCQTLQTKSNILLSIGDDYGIKDTVRLSFANVFSEEISKVIDDLNMI